MIFEYQGTLLLVSHDRDFLNNVVTSTIVFEGNGKVVEYIGGYDDWLRQRPQSASAPPLEKNSPKKPMPKPKTSKSQKLGYMQKRELQELPQKIEALESSHKELFATMADPLFYKKGRDEIATAKSEIKRIQQDIDSAYRRWEELEATISQTDYP